MCQILFTLISAGLAIAKSRSAVSCILVTASLWVMYLQKAFTLPPGIRVFGDLLFFSLSLAAIVAMYMVLSHDDQKYMAQKMEKARSGSKQ